MRVGLTNIIEFHLVVSIFTWLGRSWVIKQYVRHSSAESQFTAFYGNHVGKGTRCFLLPGMWSYVSGLCVLGVYGRCWLLPFIVMQGSAHNPLRLENSSQSLEPGCHKSLGQGSWNVMVFCILLVNCLDAEEYFQLFFYCKRKQIARNGPACTDRRAEKPGLGRHGEPRGCCDFCLVDGATAFQTADLEFIFTGDDGILK
ncbi:uncharacterized protein LOC142586278 [Dermacentor variabilis]|uniref:uncharacterized protein LOC142586278 n=1 Tax=Dermacentor variabilis TaxID=34621 RepID=UPI003F5B87D4